MVERRSARPYCPLRLRRGRDLRGCGNGHRVTVLGHGLKVWEADSPVTRALLMARFEGGLHADSTGPMIGVIGRVRPNKETTT